MSRDALDLADYLDHAISAIAFIAECTAGMDEAAFVANRVIRDVVVLNLQVVGEASRNIRRYFPQLVSSQLEVPLRSAYEMRNALKHGYHKIDYGIVWVTINEDLPALGKMLEALATELKQQN